MGLKHICTGQFLLPGTLQCSRLFPFLATKWGQLFNNYCAVIGYLIIKVFGKTQYFHNCIQALIAHGDEQFDIRSHQLRHVFVAGGNDDLKSFVRRARGQRADHIVRFHARHAQALGGVEENIRGLAFAHEASVSSAASRLA